MYTRLTVAVAALLFVAACNQDPTAVSSNELALAQNAQVITDNVVASITSVFLLAPKSSVSATNGGAVRLMATDNPSAKAFAGTFEFVHNVRVDGMLHGRVVRPPALGAKLVSVANDSIRNIPDAQIVRRNDFLAVIAGMTVAAVARAWLS